MSARDDLAIQTDGLVKAFGSTRAVDGVDLQVRRGGVYGMLGPNGAGKTTLIRVLATLLRPNGGTARVFGHDVVHDAGAVRSMVSLTGQFASVDADLTGLENLTLLAKLHGYRGRRARARAEQLLSAFGLADAGGRVVKSYSGGMRRRVDIAASIVVTPELLFLDEPTTGLDPHSRNQVWDIVRDLVDHGTTVLLTTQYLDEADRLADRIAVMDHGTVIAEGTPGELKASTGSGVLHVRLIDVRRRADAEHALAALIGPATWADADPTALSVRLGGASAVQRGLQAGRALTELAQAGIDVESFSLGQPSLDEVFLALTGDAPSEDAA